MVVLHYIFSGAGSLEWLASVFCSPFIGVLVEACSDLSTFFKKFHKITFSLSLHYKLQPRILLSLVMSLVRIKLGNVR